MLEGVLQSHTLPVMTRGLSSPQAICSLMGNSAEPKSRQ